MARLKNIIVFSQHSCVGDFFLFDWNRKELCLFVIPEPQVEFQRKGLADSGDA